MSKCILTVNQYNVKMLLLSNRGGGCLQGQYRLELLTVRTECSEAPNEKDCIELLYHYLQFRLKFQLHSIKIFKVCSSAQQGS